VPTKIEKDTLSGQDTTGHEWDGIKELNTPLPRWWLWVFYATIAWAVAYWLIYPAWPLISRHTPGILGWSSRGAMLEDIATAKARQAALVERINKTELADIPKDPELLAFALAGGRSAFGINCAPCHGAGAAGSKGYPNLNDDDWLWGGKLADIHTTLQNGIRWTAAETRESQMPAFLTDGILNAAQVGDVAEFVLSLGGQKHDAAMAGRGKAVFAEQCAACHGEEGKGNPELGAPNLTDGIWLYGGDRDTIVNTIRYARRGVMPGWKDRLDAATVKQLAVYVHSLGGGQ
jgi:cytochrome c oxidase cbb3-type subunit 3